MAVKKKENQIKKMEKRIKAYEVSNPKMAENLRGKLAGFKGKKN
jgi:hypothetical protein